MSSVVWRKSSRSNNTSNCVEVAVLPEQVLVRDSKNPDGGVLACTHDNWRALVAQVNDGDLDW